MGFGRFRRSLKKRVRRVKKFVRSDKFKSAASLAFGGVAGLQAREMYKEHKNLKKMQDAQMDAGNIDMSDVNSPERIQQDNKQAADVADKEVRRLFARRKKAKTIYTSPLGSTKERMGRKPTLG